MGFDIYGLKPKTDKGRYFRNNVWWWRPLWGYTCIEAKLSDEDNQKGNFNEGNEFPEEEALRIAQVLDSKIKDGSTKAYEEEHTKQLETMIDLPCELCGATGTRNDPIVQGPCNGCKGTGWVRPWVTNYPFNVENVQQFVDFLQECGGFAIW